MRRRLLITGFGPFPGVPSNPTADLVEALCGTLPPAVQCRVLPTHFGLTDSVMRDAARFETVLMFGVSGRARQLRYERVSRIGGSTVADEAGVHSAGPWRSRRTALPVDALVQAAQRNGFPAVPSDDAGRYVCNASYGAALAGNRNCLFVHIPSVTRYGALSHRGLVAHARWLAGTLLARVPLRLDHAERKEFAINLRASACSAVQCD